MRHFDSLGSLFAYSEFIKEPIYWVISYFIRKITDSSQVFLFVIQFITIGPIALLAYEKRKELPVSIMMTVYMLMFYQLSFNIIRQSVAAAFLLLAYYKMVNKQYIPAIIFGSFAVLFHNSGVIGVSLVLLIHVWINVQSRVLRITIVFLSIIIGIVFLLTWRQVTSWLVDKGYLNQVYDTYIDIFSGQVESKWTTFKSRTLFIEIFRIIGTAIFVLLLKGTHTGTEREIRMLKYAAVVSLIIYTIIAVGFNSTLGHRATIFLDYFQIPLFARYFPKVYVLNNGSRRPKIVVPKTGVQFCIVYCLLFNLAIFMLLNFCHTLPYVLA